MDEFSGYFSDSDDSMESDDHTSLIKEEYFSKLIEFIPAAIYTCDSKGIITYYNRAATTFWSTKPEIGKDFYYKGLKTYTTDGILLPMNETPMAKVLKHARVFTDDLIIENTQGMRFCITSRPKPIFNTLGKLIGALNLCIDVSKYYKKDSN
ncbi:MAG: hypothetical protein BM557_07245 [Flavobacterium sp. MedPE-SWcel]|uniref:hypothetical protein n=1 Tax=uncultured Flavobacterium sp. TaxID=165435 RepID=UPI00091AC8A4|nr:hypothetical protein [uncultured Flavobacterium sp.]OIQ18708.1 MAG: hypothetical protein BM557_07245 [Flavobacterium sp. MedPE-SWcel]